MGADNSTATRARYTLTWDDYMSSVYGFSDSYIEAYIAVLVGYYDKETGVNDFAVELYEVGSFLDSKKKESFSVTGLMNSYSSFFDEPEHVVLLTRRDMFGYPSEYGYQYGVTFPTQYERFPYSQVLGVFTRYNFTENDIAYSTDWTFSENTFNYKEEYSWLNTDCFSLISLEEGKGYRDLFVFDDDVLEIMSDFLFCSDKYTVSGSVIKDNINVDALTGKAVAGSLVNLLTLFPQMLILIEALPAMYSKIFTFLPEPILSVFTFALCFVVIAGIIKLFK